MKDFVVIPSIQSAFVFELGENEREYKTYEPKYACDINIHDIGNVDFLDFL